MISSNNFSLPSYWQALTWNHKFLRKVIIEKLFFKSRWWQYPLRSLKERKSRSLELWRAGDSDLLWMECDLDSVQFSRSVLPNSLRPHVLQQARLPCWSPTARAYSNSCPLSQWYHPTILCPPLFLPLSIFPSIRVFSNESILWIN